MRPADTGLVNDALGELVETNDLSEACDIIVPVVGGHALRDTSIDCGSGLFQIPDLTHSDFNEIAPVYSNGVLQRFVKEHVDSKRKAAKEEGVDPSRLPNTESQAKRLGVSRQLIVPGWMMDPKTVLAIEKTVRENAFEHLGELRDLHRGEEEAGRLATELFLETGWNPISSGRPLPRSIRESSSLGRLYERLEGARSLCASADEWKLAGVGLLPEIPLNNPPEDTCAHTAPWISALGFDSVPTLGLTQEDMDDVAGIIDAKLAGRPVESVLELRTYDRYHSQFTRAVLETAERVWNRMVAADGVHVGMLREQAPTHELKSLYLKQAEHPRTDRYATLGSSLLVGS